MVAAADVAPSPYTTPPVIQAEAQHPLETMTAQQRETPAAARVYEAPAEVRTEALTAAPSAEPIEAPVVAEVVKEVPQTTAPISEPERPAEVPAIVLPPPYEQHAMPTGLSQVETNRDKVQAAALEAAEPTPVSRRVRPSAVPVVQEALMQVETHKGNARSDAPA